MTNWDYTPFGYEPSKGAAIFASSAFAFTALAHLIQAVKYKTRFMGWIVLGCVLELIGYSTRIVAIGNAETNPSDISMYASQHGMIVMAPVFIAAAVYMILGKIIANTGEEYSPIKVKWITKIFVACDIISFIVQLSGTGLLLGNTTDIVAMDRGLDLLIAGLIVQVVSFTCFDALAVVYFIRANHVGGRWKRLIVALIISATLILMRSIYRVIEFSGGFQSPIAHDEPLFYIFDFALILGAELVFNFVHPGRSMDDHLVHDMSK